METKKLLISELIEAPYNPRKDLKPGDFEYEALRRSIEEFGYVSPVIVNKLNNTVIGGHQRLKVLKEKGEEEVLCVLVELDEQNEKLLNIALNKIEGDFDFEKLELILQEFNEEGYDATLTGFSLDEIEDLVGGFDPLADEPGDDSSTEDESNNETDTMIECPSCKHVGNKEEFKV